ncbi:BURP domain-containing protein 16-like [Tasmannia lanceolata]|uniref:BURP domain-containing protein 16-like n=1 Tax=Tasmannia lanceolata TaxID=3420 RepID=UPI0040643DE7
MGDFRKNKIGAFAYLYGKRSNPLNITGFRHNHFKVEVGTFFRQRNLVEGKQILMSDITDNLPERSFLPTILADKLQFGFPKVVKMLATDGLEPVMANTILVCEQPSMKDETKRCVMSIEAISEFAFFVIGKSMVVSSTTNTNGWGQTLIIKKVVAMNVTWSVVSCHESLFPYLVYYSHA